MNNLWDVFKFMWSWQNWIGNISADIIVAILVSLLWPQLRRAIGVWMDNKLYSHFFHHHEKLKKHLTDHIDNHMEEVHKKLDNKS